MLEKKISITSELFQGITTALRKDPVDLLKTDTAKLILGKQRFDSVKRQLSVKESKHSIKDNLSGNLSALNDFGSVRRVSRFTSALLVADDIYENAANMKVLTVGPRTELEVFALISLGFRASNITGLDQFSYSKYIEVGDMHHMPFKDSSFDLVLLGWVLAYSTDPILALRESVRVLKPTGYLAIGLTRLPEDQKKESKVWQPTSGELTDELERFVRLNVLISSDNSNSKRPRTIFLAQINK